MTYFNSLFLVLIFISKVSLKQTNPCAVAGTGIIYSVIIRIYIYKGISYASGQSDHFYSFEHILVSFLIAFITISNNKSKIIYLSSIIGIIMNCYQD